MKKIKLLPKLVLFHVPFIGRKEVVVFVEDSVNSLVVLYRPILLAIVKNLGKRTEHPSCKARRYLVRTQIQNKSKLKMDLPAIA